MEKMKLGLVGCGFLGTIIADAWRNGLLEDYELTGCVSRTPESSGKVARSTGCRDCGTVEELLSLKPDYVIEAASLKTVTDIAEKVLRSGADLIVLSIGAFADAAFYEKISGVARETGNRVHLASGAIGGFDVLRTASLMGEIRASIATEKGPASLRGTPLFSDMVMNATERCGVFSGSAREAIGLLPTKVNVAVAASLATAGPEKTAVTITSVPGFVGDDHRIEVSGDEVHAIVDIYSKTSAIAGWSVVALLRNLASPIMF